ncbi:hypothetical protein D3C80_1137150 [compost metagenome]
MKTKSYAVEVIFISIGVLMLLVGLPEVSRMDGGFERYVVLAMPLGMILASLLSLIETYRKPKK